MLTITVPAAHYWDDANELFVDYEEVTLQLEHSLVALSKWESIFEKPFLGDTPKTTAETLDYVKAMTISDNVDPDVYKRLSDDNIKSVSTYIEAKMSATTFHNLEGNSGRKETITAELIYYWLVALQIPFECQDWHLNRLLTLIQVCNLKNNPDKKSKRPTRDVAAERRALNEKRKAQMNTKG